MITRLHQLRAVGFRSFLKDTGPIPLDADVVLIYGPNGAGKTGLMSAIEFALTGAVAHLQKYEDDYPRCLRNTEQQERADVWLEYLHTDEQYYHHHSSIVATDHSDQAASVLPSLSPHDSLLFTDRCYLSQSRLSRLLEVYQATAKGTEQHLIRFARELLGLDVLENLINGLYVVKDERRLKNAVPSLDALSVEVASVAKRVETLRADVHSKDRDWRAAIAQIEHFDREYTSNASNLDQLQERIRALGGNQAKGQLSEGLKRLQQQRGELESNVGFLSAIPSSDTDRPDQLSKRLQGIIQSATEVRGRLTDKLAFTVQLLSDIGWSNANVANTSDLDRLFRLLQSEVSRLISVLEDEIAQRKTAANELQKAQTDLASADSDLRSITTVVKDLATISRKRVELLQLAIMSTEGTSCPVCGRDYTEISPMDLRQHLQDELANLGITIAQIESQSAQRLSLETRRQAASRRIATASERLADGKRRYPSPERFLERLQEANTNLEHADSDRVTLAQLQEEEATTASRIRAVQIRSRQYEDGVNSVKSLAVHLNIGVPAGLPASKLSQLVRDQLNDQIMEVEADIAKHEAMLAAYENARAMGKALADATQALGMAEERLLRLRAAEQATGDARTTARAVEKAAQNVKARLIQEVFNDKLNTLCQALYRRLVRLEAFDPNLSEPRPVRGAIKAGIQAMSRNRPDIQPFQELASVVSESNLNTAALSLFLSLNLIQNPKHRVLLLDDPVQSMDDIHVVQLAALLRSLVRETKRQLIVAVHERAMFDYLALELGPTRYCDSLIAIELFRDADGLNTSVRAERRLWRPDGLSFGSSSQSNSAG